MDYITEKSEFVDNTIPLLKTNMPVKGYDGTDIGEANMQAQVLGNRTLWLKEANTTTSKQVTKLINEKEKEALQHAEEINALKTGKQDTLVSGTNVNTVFGQSLTNVKDGGITLSDAKDFFQVLKTHLKVTEGLSLSEDGQSLILASNTGSEMTMNIRPVNAPRSNTLIELKARRRPAFDCRAYAFRVSSQSAQPATTITFNSYLSDSDTTPYAGPNTARLCFTPDTNEKLRWSSLNTASIDDSTLPDTRMAISPDGNNWYVFNADSGKFEAIGELKLDEASAEKLMQQGNTLTEFNQSGSSALAQFMAGQELVPLFNVAFAAIVNSEHQDFTPRSADVTFNASTSWVLQQLSDVPITITSDTITFVPRQPGDYICCFAY